MTLAGLARDTSRIRLGSLMSAATFRSPGPLAVAVTQVDEMSGGRVELGLGTGWYEPEHAAFGIPLPPVGERFERLAEQLAIITGLWTTPEGERFDHAGAHYRAGRRTRRCAPPSGRTRRSSSAARARAAPRGWRPGSPTNTTSSSPARPTPRSCSTGSTPSRRRWAGVAPGNGRRCCARSASPSRVDATPRRSSAGRRCCGRRCGPPRPGPTARSTRWSTTSGQFASIGAERAYLRIADLADLDHLDLIAAEVMPQVAG